jgi:hypothetical protein
MLTRFAKFILCVALAPLAAMPALAQNATATALTVSPDSVLPGAAATLTATVTRTSASGVPAGNVTFTCAGRTLGSGTLNGSGVATVQGSSAGFGLGAYPIVATYQGDSTDASSKSPVVYAYIQSATTTTFSLSPTSLLQNQSATLTATVVRNGNAGTPTGSVTFSANGYTFGSAKLNGSGVATLQGSTANIAIGTYPVVATYKGDSQDVASASAPVVAHVQSATLTSFTLAPTSVQQNQPAVLTASVARSGNTGTPTGYVTFLNGSQSLGSIQLVNGVAKFTQSAAFPVGTYTLTARYDGDTLDQGSSSTAVKAAITPAVDVLTYRNNVGRTGVQSAESILNLTNVNSNTFGKIFSFVTDGFVFSQPLYVSNYPMNDGKSHNVLFVTTSAGSVYAFDADNNNPTAGYLWHVSVIPPNEQTVTPTDYNCPSPSPNSTIIGTPVIDRTLGVLYLVGKTGLVANNTTTYYQRIHALNLTDGTEKLNGPTVITASVPGTGAGAVSGTVTFNPLTQNQRAALVEANGSVWITWASHCDLAPYHGWTIGYNATDVSQQTGVFNNTPNGSDGGIWMSAGGIAADNDGHLFTVAGNGTFDINTGGSDYADSIQRLDIGPSGLTPGDWFAVSNQAYLSNHDLDVGTADGVLFDDPASGIAPHLLATGDKSGRIYVVNRGNLGGYDMGTNGVDGLNDDIADFSGGSILFSSFGYFNGRLYVGAGGSPLSGYDYTPGTATTAGSLAASPSTQTTHVFSSASAVGGAQPIFSANGPDATASNAIAWVADLSGASDVLYAFAANNLANQLYVTSTNHSRDQGPPVVKFSVPIIANGRVYVPGEYVVAVYGLLN